MACEFPWKRIKAEHRNRYLATMVRAYTRREAGLPLSAIAEERLSRFLESAERDGFVVHYDPDTEQGFFRVPRREGVDTGIVRDPAIP